MHIDPVLLTIASVLSLAADLKSVFIKYNTVINKNIKKKYILLRLLKWLSHHNILKRSCHGAKLE